MTENTRTATFIGAALVLLVAAGLINRKPAVEEEGSLAGKVLFSELKSPGDVSGLEIVSFDASDSRPNVFKVVRDATGWTLPSHSNYPADAEKQVGSAASSLIDLKVLSVVSSLPSEHAKYGVVAPDPEKAPPGAEGVGKLVTVLDKSGKSLARLVIGHEDKRSADDIGSEGELRFVRALPHDLVYRVALPATKFTTSFADWIETDLLKLDPWNITQVTLKDYTFDIGEDAASGQIVAAYDQTSNIDLKFNDKDAKWSLEKLMEFKDGAAQPVELAENEELNATRLNEMKTALDDLKIVDVRRKPAGMSGNLKAKKQVFTDPESAQSLIQRGFFPGRAVGDDAEILSSDGEVLVRMKDGVEYVLRFGRTAGVGSEEKKDDSAQSKSGNQSKSGKESGKDEEEDASGTNLNRFIMVSAQFNPDLIPKPELEDVPGGAADKSSEETTETDPAGSKEGAAKSEETKSGDAKSGKEESTKAEAKKETKSAGDKGKAKTSGDAQKKTGAQNESKDDKSAEAVREPMHFVKLQDEPAKGDAAKSSDAKAKSGKAPVKSGKSSKSKGGESEKATPSGVSAKKETKGQDSAKKGDAKADDAAKSGAADAGDKDGKKKPSAEEQEELALERKRIETENQRKQKEYDEQIEKGEARARELNDRFADWYYVVSESTYRKIHLGRDDVIKQKAEEKKSDDADATKIDESDAGIDVDALKLPPLKRDPFKKRGEAKKEAATKNDE